MYNRIYDGYLFFSFPVPSVTSLFLSYLIFFCVCFYKLFFCIFFLFLLLFFFLIWWQLNGCDFHLFQLWATALFNSHIWYSAMNNTFIIIKIQKTYRWQFTWRTACCIRWAQRINVRMRMLWQKSDRTFTGTKICFIDVRRNYPIPPKFTKINAQRVPTAPRVFLIFPTISGRMTFCAVLAYVSRLNFNVWSLHVCVCFYLPMPTTMSMSILYAQISIRSHITRSHNKMKRENEMNRQIDDMKRKMKRKKIQMKKKKTKTEKNNKTQ